MAPLIEASRVGPSRPRKQPKLTLILGGARSGKSAYAEGLALHRARAGEALYLATAEALDGEMKERIDRHQARRGTGWITVEEPLDLVGAIRRHDRAGRPILVDCLTLWLSNVMAADKDVGEAAGALLAALREAAAPILVISNEVGTGIVPENRLARVFRDQAGFLNQKIAAAADEVVFVVAGLPLTLKQAGRPAERAP
jgi:adenosylcobinamide kinase/adenosylcobinamide-phosphate guanylyltransferase